ncbi:hypothetical protein [Streptomyces niveus]|uniref:hypothetical protein n=1 Tax=Streptomyces niveus TaxID=193462 RepID=UPI00386AE458
MSTTPEPFRYVDADQFCLSARLLPGLDAGALSISVEGDGEPQSVHVPVANMPQILSGLAAASGVQPDTRPEAYGDGKGRAYCLRCAHHVGASVPLTANDVDAHELCPSCGRHVVDVAQETEPARPVPDTERRERYAKAFFALTGLSERRTWESLSPLLRKVHYERADVALAVADAEQQEMADGAAQFTAAIRRENARLRAELEKARDLLQRAESYLSALHGSVARHDNMGAGLGCAGCELRDKITAHLTAARSGGQAESAHPDKVVFIAEYFEHDRWTYLGTSDDRPSPERLRARTHGLPARLVRATTTYGVEPGGPAEDGAQQK